jgi:hypothetical protein
MKEAEQWSCPNVDRKIAYRVLAQICTQSQLRFTRGFLCGYDMKRVPIQKRNS